MMPSAKPLETGVLLKGRYAVERELGRGGFALTYLARDQQLHGRRVVIKVLLDNAGAGSWFENKFAQELQALSRIDHPGVVAPLDSGRLEDGSPYLVMQFVDGRTLRALMSEGPIPLDRVAEIIRQVGQALAAVHGHSVYHRDLKPDNIMVQASESGDLIVRLIDFGIASVLDAGSQTSVHTQVVGSLHYMAPEQLEGRATQTTDIYAAAVLAYELVTGVRPFAAEHPVELSRLQRAGVSVPPRKLRPGLSKNAEDLILRGLAVEPRSRPANAGIWAGQLAQALTQPAEAPARRTYVPWIIAAAIVLVLAGAAGIRYFSHRHARPEPTPPVPLVSSLPARPMAERRIDFGLLVRGSGAEPRLVRATLVSLGRRERFRVQLVPSDGGHVYLFSEEAAGAGPLNILFPSPTANGGSSFVAAAKVLQIPGESWFGLGPNAGRDRLWVVWSRSAEPFLEEVRRWANPRDKGEIGDAAARNSIRELLRSHQVAWRPEGGRLELRTAVDQAAASIDIDH